MNAQNVTQILDALAARFGTTAAHLWGVLIRQVYVTAILDTAIFVVLAVATYILVGMARAQHKKDPNGYDDWTTGVTIISAVAGFLTLLGGFFAKSSVVQAIVNPEYGALKLIGEAIGGK